MNTNNTKRKNINMLVAIALLGIGLNPMGLVTASEHERKGHQDFLYVGDEGDNSVKRFNALTGAYTGDFVAPVAGGINGPRGMIFTKGNFLLVNQNVNQDYASEILRYDGKTGAFLNALVPCFPAPPNNRACDPNAPFTARGIIRGNGNTLLVADLQSSPSAGRVAQFDLKTGVFKGNLDLTGYTGLFFPRGIVKGPDDLLYVSNTALPAGDPLAGSVLRFNAKTGKFIDVFTSNLAPGCAAALHRPEGLVFGPDEKLYVTSFRENANDNDKVLIFNGKTGACLDKIELAPPVNATGVGAINRAYAQALLFGPHGQLYVPISGPNVIVEGFSGNHTGEVRRYNVKTKTFDLLVPAFVNGGHLISPWYLSFDETDPSSLEFDD